MTSVNHESPSGYILNR